jgi:hypothetical protein
MKRNDPIGMDFISYLSPDISEKYGKRRVSRGNCFRKFTGRSAHSPDFTLQLEAQDNIMNFLDKYTTEVEIFVNVCHQLARNLYVTSSGGNLAWKLEDKLLLITPTQLNHVS